MRGRLSAGTKLFLDKTHVRFFRHKFCLHNGANVTRTVFDL